mgnify:CR=1 FL=1
MFLSVENIKNLKSNKYISYDDFKRNFKVYPEKNDILMTRIGDIGTTNIVKENSLKAYYVSLALLKCKSINPYYLNFAMNSNFVQNGLKLRSLLTAIPMKINKDQIGETDIIYPVDFKEQSKIGKVFDNIDNLITLHHRKYTYIFYSWEQRKAKDLCSITTGKSNTQDQVQDGKYPFYIRSDVPVRSNRYLYDEEAVITIGDGNIGRVFHYVNGKFDLHQRCYKMADFKALTAKYFYYYFSTKFYERAMSMTAKATVDSVRLEMISDMEIKFPKSTTEQTNISELFTNLDNLITLHQHKELKRRNDNNEHLRW